MYVYKMLCKLYIDMDGVLADFEGHFKDIFKDNLYDGESCKDYMNRVGPDKFWDDIYNIDTFWLDIKPLHNNIKDIWKTLEKKFNHIMILTSPSRDIKCRIQKRLWVDKYISPKIPILFETNKYRYASKYSILIDDTESKISDWIKYGGQGILFKDNWDQSIWIILNKIKKDASNYNRLV